MYVLMMKWEMVKKRVGSSSNNVFSYHTAVSLFPVCLYFSILVFKFRFSRNLTETNSFCILFLLYTIYLAFNTNQEEKKNKYISKKNTYMEVKKISQPDIGELIEKLDFVDGIYDDVVTTKSPSSLPVKGKWIQECSIASSLNANIIVVGRRRHLVIASLHGDGWKLNSVNDEQAERYFVFCICCFICI